MSDKHLSTRMKKAITNAKNAWWLEHPTGIRLFIKLEGSQYVVSACIPWRGLRAAVARKDKK
jgi:hypothetical protein